MDALEFLMEQKRMCGLYKGCYGCPFEKSHCVISHVTSDEDYERIIAIVEQWSKEHPRKTRQSVFLEQWPNCRRGDDGVIRICPISVDKKYSCVFSECSECRRKFWMQEVE